MKKNSLALGIIGGLIAPIIGLLCFWLFSYRQMSVHEFITYTHRYQLLSGILTKCLFFNLATFFLFLYFKLEDSSKGVLMATVIYGIIIVLILTGII